MGENNTPTALKGCGVKIPGYSSGKLGTLQQNNKLRPSFNSQLKFNDFITIIKVSDSGYFTEGTYLPIWNGFFLLIV